MSDFVRPLLFENADLNWPYSILGTCFLVKYLQRHWAITAQHTLANHGYTPAQALISRELGSRHFFGVTDAFTCHGSAGNIEEPIDMLALELDITRISPDEPWAVSFYDLDTEHERDFSSGPLAVTAYPASLARIDYNSCVISYQPITIAASYIGPSPGVGRIRIRLNSDGELSDHDGFSGAPVFVVTLNDNTPPSPARLFGMILGSVQLMETTDIQEKIILHVAAIRAMLEGC